LKNQRTGGKKSVNLSGGRAWWAAVYREMLVEAFFIGAVPINIFVLVQGGGKLPGGKCGQRNWGLKSF